LYIDFDPMDDEKSLGKYLKAIREEKEISIDELAESTRINKAYLVAIEADKYGSLPEGPYLNLFLKSYTEALEIDYEKIKSYLEVVTETPPRVTKGKPSQLKPIRDQKKPEQKALKPKEKTTTPEEEGSWNGGETKKYLAIIGAFAFLAFITLICIVVFGGGSNDKNGHVEQLPIVEDQKLVDSSAIPLEDDARDVFLAKYENLTLVIYPETQQAISVISDGEIQSKLVNPSQKWELVAEDSLLVSCERKDNSKFYINSYLVNTSDLDFTGENNVTIDRTNWIDFVDTTETE
jgi:transcriptional regulator with XRE-family HTH domain